MMGGLSGVGVGVGALLCCATILHVTQGMPTTLQYHRNRKKKHPLVMLFPVPTYFA